MTFKRKLRIDKEYIVTGWAQANADYELRKMNGSRVKVLEQRDDSQFLHPRALCIKGVWTTGVKTGFLEELNGVRLRRWDARPICRCKAYAWPHRQGGGQCPGEDGPFCETCGQPCDYNVTKDFTVSEAWGVRRTDPHTYIESTCCQAGVFIDAELTIEASLSDLEG